MTPEQKLKHAILLKSHQWAQTQPAVAMTAENIDELYDEAEGEDCGLQDARNDVRCSGIRTDLPSPLSRHYEADEVAAKMPDGSWIGWTYWYGGGKHGEPDSVPWMEHAYELSCAEEQKVVTVRTFTKASSSSPAQ